RDALGLTLGLAVLWKVKDFRQFQASLGGFGFAAPLRPVVAVAVLAAEAATAALAFLPAADRMVGGAGAGLGLVFLASQTYLVATGEVHRQQGRRVAGVVRRLRPVRDERAAIAGTE